MHRLLAIAAAAGLAVSGGAPAGAQTAPSFDLHAAIRYALEHDPAVIADRATVADAEARYARYHAAEFPQIAGQLQNQLYKTNGYASGSFGQIGASPAQNYSQNTAQVVGTLALYNGSSNQIAAQQARRDAEAARQTLARAQATLAADVANAFWNLAARRDAVHLAEGDLAYQRALEATARAQERVGRVAGVDVLRARVGALRSQAALTSATSARADAQEALAQRIGAAPDATFRLPETLPEPPLPATADEVLVETARGNRPDVAAARAQLASARLADAQIETDRRPQLSLNGSFGNQTSPTSFVQAQAQLNATNAARGAAGLPPLSTTITRGVPGFWQIGASETFTLPLIEYGARHANHAAARAHIDAARAQLASVENGVAVDVRTAARAVRTAAANLGTSREAAAAGAESARVAQVQYRSGLISLTDATQAQQTALSAQSDLVTARAAYLGALARLRAAVGNVDPVNIAPEAP